MLQQLSRLVLVVSCVSLLSGCLFGHGGYIHDRQQDYLVSKSEPNLKIPANLQLADMTPALAIPSGDDFNQAQPPSLIPPIDENAMLQKNFHATQQAPQSTSATLGTGSNGFPVLELNTSYYISWIKIKNVLGQLNYQVLGSDKKTGVYEVLPPSSIKDHTIYQIKLAVGTQGTLISVLDQSGSDVAANVSTNILKQLQTYLSK